MDSVTDPRFKRGDLVRHRASGELAVVLAPARSCVVHRGMDAFGAHGPRLGGPHPDCRFEFNGSYDLDLGFKQDVLTAEEYLLEAVEVERGGES